MKLARILTAVLLVLTTSSVAFAQGDDGGPVTNDKFGVEIEPPEKWEVTQGKDKAVANFKHRGSQSQIEIVGTKLMTQDVSDVFFETFHKTLKDSDFEKLSQESATIGDYEGTQTNYKFKHSGVTLEVVVFEFLRESTAWLVVGYMQDVEKEKYIGDFKQVVKNMTFTQKGGDEGGE
jgi:hypothetical protein